VSPTDPQPSAGNAYLDLFLQVGVVGVVLFCALAGLAFLRSWLLASRRRTVAYAWPALVLVVLVIASIGSSAILGEAAWSLLVICVLKASDGLSWRQALASSDAEPPDSLRAAGS
jgi:exopolysaccharide production protein ExoQ